MLDSFDAGFWSRRHQETKCLLSTSHQQWYQWSKLTFGSIQNQASSIQIIPSSFQTQHYVLRPFPVFCIPAGRSYLVYWRTTSVPVLQGLARFEPRDFYTFP